MKKLGLFVDVQNIYYTTRDAYGRSFDYRAFWQHLKSQGDIVIANAYAIERNHEAQKKFQLIKILEKHKSTGTLIFSHTKHGAERLKNKLFADGFKATSVHGNISTLSKN